LKRIRSRRAKVNETMIEKRDRVVKTQWAEDEAITAWGGLALVESLAHRTGLWSQARRRLPRRTRTEAGYDSTTVLASMIHGLLSGSRGTYAAEPLRQDEALRRLVGLEAGAPEEATVWRALGQWAERDGATALGDLQRRLCRRLIAQTPMAAMRVEGFTPLFLDGTWLEVGRDSQFEGAKFFDGAAKLMLSTLWVGPYLAAQSFAVEGQGEMTASLGLIDAVWRQVVAPAKLKASALFLIDALYGNQTALADIEARKEARYVAGAGGLAGVETTAAEQPETQWRRAAHADPKAWPESAWCVHGFMAADWPAPRTVVTHRWRPEGEMFFHYASVLTNLTPDDPRLIEMMRRCKIGFAEAVGRLYDRKGAMENQFKDALIDLGLHHPPCRELARNEVFYAVAALALDLAVGVRRIAMRGAEGAMRLWRLRREFFAVPARVARHARQMQARLYSTSNRLRSSFESAMARLACC
jgi:hypothetical protein